MSRASSRLRIGLVASAAFAGGLIVASGLNLTPFGYAQQGQPAGAGGPGGPTGAAGGRPGAEQPAGATAGRADDVVEADYEIVDDDKK